MRKVKANNLKIGDWILDKGVGLKGKFKVARIKGYECEEWQEIDLEKGEIKNLGENGKGVIQKDDGYIRIFNEKEVKSLKELKKRFLMLKNLEEEQKEVK